MLRPSKDMLDLAISVTDGATGSAKDQPRDDARATRYLVVDTASWPSSRRAAPGCDKKGQRARQQIRRESP